MGWVPLRSVLAARETDGHCRALIEFDSVEQAVAAYHSPGYQQALTALGDGAVREIRIIEAVA